MLAENGNEPIKNVYLDEGWSNGYACWCWYFVFKPNKPAALAFIEFLHSKAAQETFTNNALRVPLVTGIKPNALLPDINSLNSPSNLNFSVISMAGKSCRVDCSGRILILHLVSNESKILAR